MVFIDSECPLVIPSCGGLLDCFNNQYTHSKKYGAESVFRLEGEINTPIIISLFSYIYLNHFSADTNSTWSFKTSGYKKYLGYKEGSKSKDLYSQLSDLSSLKYYYAELPQGQAVSVTFNDTKTIMTVRSKYFEELYTAMKAVSGVYNRHGHKTDSGLPSYTSMIKASILKERNIGAAEIVFELCKLISRRGPLDEKQFAHISMLTLVNRCPSLHRIKDMSTKEGNRVFRETLKKAFELLEMYTTITEEYNVIHFEFPKVITPTKECELKIYYKKIFL